MADRSVAEQHGASGTPTTRSSNRDGSKDDVGKEKPDGTANAPPSPAPAPMRAVTEVANPGADAGAADSADADAGDDAGADASADADVDADAGTNSLVTKVEVLTEEAQAKQLELQRAKDELARQNRSAAARALEVCMWMLMHAA